MLPPRHVSHCRKRLWPIWDRHLRCAARLRSGDEKPWLWRCCDDAPVEETQQIGAGPPRHVFTRLETLHWSLKEPGNSWKLHEGWRFHEISLLIFLKQLSSHTSLELFTTMHRDSLWLSSGRGKTLAVVQWQSMQAPIASFASQKATSKVVWSAELQNAKLRKLPL